jgi:hypothetical protein
MSIEIRLRLVPASLLCGFLLACGDDDGGDDGGPSSTTGTIGLTVSPPISPLDPDGFAVSLNGGAEQALPESGELWLEDLPAGSHEVTLTDVDEPCVVPGDNPRTITVAAGDTAFVSFNPVCTGAIKLTVNPSESPLDPDGFTVSLDGGANQALPESGELWLEDLPAGSHEVALTDVDEPCEVRRNPQTITVPAGDTVFASFSPACTGALGVFVSPSETSFDPDGFTVSLDGGADQALSEEGGLWLENLPAGIHEVTLTDLDESCGVADRNPRRVDVPAGDTAFVHFHPFCANPGEIVVHTFPRGGRPPRSYSLLLDGVEYATIGNFDEAILANVEPGDHTVTLSGVIVRCGGDRTETVTVVEGKPAHVDFIVVCEL